MSSVHVYSVTVLIMSVILQRQIGVARLGMNIIIIVSHSEFTNFKQTQYHITSVANVIGLQI